MQRDKNPRKESRASVPRKETRASVSRKDTSKLLLPKLSIKKRVKEPAKETHSSDKSCSKVEEQEQITLEDIALPIPKILFPFPPPPIDYSEPEILFPYPPPVRFRDVQSFLNDLSDSELSSTSVVSAAINQNVTWFASTLNLLTNYASLEQVALEIIYHEMRYSAENIFDILTAYKDFQEQQTAKLFEKHSVDAPLDLSDDIAALANEDIKIIGNFYSDDEMNLIEQVRTLPDDVDYDMHSMCEQSFDQEMNDENTQAQIECEQRCDEPMSNSDEASEIVSVQIEPQNDSGLGSEPHSETELKLLPDHEPTNEKTILSQEAETSIPVKQLQQTVHQIEEISENIPTAFEEKLVSDIQIISDSDESKQLQEPVQQIEENSENTPTALVSESFIQIISDSDDSDDIEVTATQRFTEGETFMIRIIVVESPSCFWFQNDDKALRKLMTQIKLFYTKLDDDKLKISAKDFKRGECIAADFYGIWHRARIMSKADKKGNVKIFFIDYGSKSEIHFTKARYLLRKFSQISPKALQGKLSGVIGKDGFWTAQSIEAFKQMTTRKELMIKVVYFSEQKEVLEMKIYNEKSKSIADALVAAGFAVNQLI